MVQMERWYDNKWGNLKLDSDDEEDEVTDQFEMERRIISGDTATVDELKRDGNQALYVFFKIFTPTQIFNYLDIQPTCSFKLFRTLT